MDKKEAIFSIEVCDAWNMPICRFEIIQDGARCFSRYVERLQIFNLNLDKDLEKATRVYANDGQRQAFERTMEEFDIEDRYTYYPNCDIRSMTLGGMSWVMSYNGRQIQGANFAPEGLHELALNLQGIFGVDGLPSFLDFPEGFDVKDCPDSRVFLDYGIHTYNSKEYHEIKEGNAEIGLEELNTKIDAVSKDMLHDIRLYAEKHPDVEDYATILQKNGIKLDAEKMKVLEVDRLDAECIMALFVATSRMDHVEGSDCFSTCFKDGTFQAWLERLADATVEN